MWANKICHDLIVLWLGVKNRFTPKGAYNLGRTSFIKSYMKRRNFFFFKHIAKDPV